MLLMTFKNVNQDSGKDLCNVSYRAAERFWRPKTAKGGLLRAKRTEIFLILPFRLAWGAFPKILRSRFEIFLL